MFTGIVTSIGRVRRAEPGRGAHDLRLLLSASWPDVAAISIGASVACAGCCLTVVRTGVEGFAVELSAETLARTNPEAWRVGAPVNLERALRLGDELGGHLVSGHVDGLAELLSADAVGGSHRLRLRAPAALAAFVAEKGSVALDGVSLTVNRAEGDVFEVNVIPHTWAATTLGALRPGARPHLEIDMLARYLARMRAFPPAVTTPGAMP